MYLLYRHPLRGGKIHDMNDPQKDETIGMGEKALFVEHPTDTSNRVKPSQLKVSQQPWADPAKVPFTVTGPYLSELFFNLSFCVPESSPNTLHIANSAVSPSNELFVSFSTLNKSGKFSLCKRIL